MNTLTLDATFGSVVVLVAALLYGLVCAVVAWRFTTARRARARSAPAVAEAVRFAARDGRVRIDAWHLPAKAARGAIVFVHGKDACRGDELKSPTFALARAFVAAGLSVLMIDLRGHGSSGGARLTYGANERFDVLAPSIGCAATATSASACWARRWVRRHRSSLPPTSRASPRSSPTARSSTSARWSNASTAACRTCRPAFFPVHWRWAGC
ncbi:MAG TPA: hypothetical protein VFF72_05645 [Caldimonas sp.]|nr:hypothetical protein [Caldimonas sp.]